MNHTVNSNKQPLLANVAAVARAVEIQSREHLVHVVDLSIYLSIYLYNMYVYISIYIYIYIEREI